MKTLGILFLLSIFSTSFSTRQKTNLAWREPLEHKIPLIAHDYIEQTTKKHDKIFHDSPNTTLAAMGQFPHYALLMMNQNDEWNAFGSSIIAPYWILATASTLNEHDRARAFAGIIDRTTLVNSEYSSGEIYKNAFLLHPFFDASNIHKHNVGLIHVCRPILWTVNIQPAKLPFRIQSDMELTNNKGVLSGFGDLGDGEKSKYLYWYDSPVLSHEVCQQKVGTSEYDPKHNFCVRHGSHCWNDNGGGLTIDHDGREAIYGLYIKTKKSCEPGSPTLFVSVVDNVDWIYDVTGIHENFKDLKIDNGRLKISNYKMKGGTEDVRSDEVRSEESINVEEQPHQEPHERESFSNTNDVRSDEVRYEEAIDVEEQPHQEPQERESISVSDDVRSDEKNESLEETNNEAINVEEQPPSEPQERESISNVEDGITIATEEP